MNDTLSYIHQDSLGSSSVMSDANGQSLSSITFYPFGKTRTGSVSTDKQFTGQRLDGTGLYYYGARYYDPEIGRFISADTIVGFGFSKNIRAIDNLTISYTGIGMQYLSASGQNNIALLKYIDSQSLNRYSYVNNNPLKYTDPTGHINLDSDDGSSDPEDTEPMLNSNHMAKVITEWYKQHKSGIFVGLDIIQIVGNVIEIIGGATANLPLFLIGYCLSIGASAISLAIVIADYFILHDCDIDAIWMEIITTTAQGIPNPVVQIIANLNQLYYDSTGGHSFIEDFINWMYSIA